MNYFKGVRIYPQTWNNAIALRVHFSGCYSISQPTTVTVITSKESTVTQETTTPTYWQTVLA